MATKQKQGGWGFDVRELRPDIRPQDDYFHHVNQAWIDANPIPAVESRWGTFIELRFKVEKQLKTIVEELDGKKALAEGSPEQMVRDLYRSGMDMKRRNELGASPLKPVLALADKVKKAEDLTPVIAKLHRIGVGALFGSGIDQDSKQSDRYRLHLFQDGLGMPDREYYLKDDEESVRVRGAYETHIQKLFMLLGYGKKDAAQACGTVLAMETALARASMKKEDRRDPEKTYNRYTPGKLRKLAPSIDWARYLTGIGAAGADPIIVGQPDFMSGVEKLLATTPLEDVRTYLRFHIANDLSGLLSDAFIKQSFSFYGTVLSGTKTMRPLWRRVLSSVNGSLGEVLGQVYVDRHFPPAAKQRMLEVVEDLFTAYEARLRSLDWMGPATKRKALAKLGALTRKIGYPDKWRSYKGLKIDPADYFGNILRSAEYEHRREVRKLPKPIDLGEWFMYPQTVNAYFAPNMNDIVFPAAILQPPFFDLHADDAINYGCIGMVIAHEMTHGFDDEGSKFDAKGNLKQWWTDDDRKRFEAKAKKVEKQFNQYEVADGVKVNGKLTLGENIADLGGLSIAYDAYQLQLARTGRKDIDGLTPEQRFFIAFTLFEREHSRPEHQKLQVLNDPHSPGIFRIHGPLSNFTPFYEAYGVKKGDALYRPPKDREMVW
jgi:putative endopeptidase